MAIQDMNKLDLGHSHTIQYFTVKTVRIVDTNESLRLSIDYRTPANQKAVTKGRTPTSSQIG